MSYDASYVMEIDGARVVVFDAGNYTWNILPMITAALSINPELAALAEDVNVFRHLEGKRGKEIAGWLEVAVKDMQARASHYASFDSPNGWGRYVTAFPWFKKIWHGAVACPDARLSLE